jgi:TM2 domain-containing membrane protein YozV
VREKYCWLVVGGWFVLIEKYWWLISQVNRVLTLDVSSETEDEYATVCKLYE